MCISHANTVKWLNTLNLKKVVSRPSDPKDLGTGIGILDFLKKKKKKTFSKDFVSIK
jgi:hypothetical protein